MSTEFKSHNDVPEALAIRSIFCKARHFLLNQKVLNEYHALFADATDEHIDPITGRPRPDPDLADKTKGYIVPNQVIADYPLRTIASRFTGLMRQAVGCYQSTGQNAPFTYGWEKTHGIVTFTVGADVRYWVIEVSPQGVYAAPVTVKADCCGSFRVDSYLTAPSTELALHSRWLNFDQVNIQRLLRPEEIAPLYGLGSPWFDQHGWAFSASGRLAQNVVVDTSAIPVSHYVGARVKLTLSYVGNNRLFALPQILENEKSYTLVRGLTVWTPTGTPGEWVGADGPTGNEFPNPIAVIPVQDAPIHVYYSGEDEKVTRWVLNFEQVAEQSQGSNLAQLVPNPPQPFPATCRVGSGNDTYSPGYNSVPYIVQSAHNSDSCGFRGPGFEYAGVNESVPVHSATQTLGGGDHIEEVFVNFFTLDPTCYYYSGSPPVLVTQCTCQFKQVDTVQTLTTELKDFTQAQSQRSSVVLFQEEREAILAVMLHGESQNGSNSFNDIFKVKTHETVTIVSAGGPPTCPCYEWDIDVAGNQSFNPDGTSGETAINVSTYSAQSAFAIGAFQTNEDLSVSVDGLIENENIFPFTGHGPSHEFANSSVFALHGNDTAGTDKAYTFTESMVLVGGFAYTLGELIAFIGKV